MPRRWESDRTGEDCPFCHKGKLYPTGKSFGKEDASQTQYECDECHQQTDATGIGVGSSIGASGVAKANSKRS